MKLAHIIMVMILSCGFSACNINQHVPLTKVALNLQGNWINQKYLDTLRLYKSPKRAQQAAGICIINIQKDTFRTSTQVLLSFQQGDQWLLERDSLGLVFCNAFDTKQKLYAQVLSKKKMKLGQELFVRYSDIMYQEDKNFAIVEMTLFAGRYDWNGSLVEFGNDGRIKGMEKVGVEAYIPVIDYYYYGLKIDQLWLGKGKESSKYGFEFKGKKLYIYQLICSNNASCCADEVKLGDVVFELNGK